MYVNTNSTSEFHSEFIKIFAESLDHVDLFVTIIEVMLQILTNYKRKHQCEFEVLVFCKGKSTWTTFNLSSCPAHSQSVPHKKLSAIIFCDKLSRNNRSNNYCDSGLATLNNI